ncbi:Hypothetical predicted protein [Mytilus galloprovincialis]|uniref:Bursicon n=1 Tax=Mytilus galloprovincialis TaxID=29158 RepID=A0A8B6DXT8_MYTGA|nr:Hypothetical predicted protein [Mytilus galloprovincialis]
MVTKLIAASITLQVVASLCARQRTIHTIQYLDCRPKRVLSFACSGTCSSYSKPSSLQPGEFDKHCECCQEKDTMTRQTRVMCPNEGGDTPFKYKVVSVSIPVSCMCQPCSQFPLSNAQSEPDNIHERKRTKNNTYIDLPL